MKKILITGSNGFIGKNLLLRIPKKNIIYTYNRNDSLKDLKRLIISGEVDLIYHLAGENRPLHDSEFHNGNVSLTKEITDAIIKSRKKIPVIFSSSIQALLENPYGESKKAAEEELVNLNERTKCGVMVYRLPGIFGKGCKPNYNSVVATFCHNIINDIDIRVDSKDKVLNLVYIDDLIDEFI